MSRNKIILTSIILFGIITVLFIPAISRAEGRTKVFEDQSYQYLDVVEADPLDESLRDPLAVVEDPLFPDQLGVEKKIAGLLLWQIIAIIGAAVVVILVIVLLLKRKKKGKIIGIFIFLLLVSCILYLSSSIYAQSESDNTVTIGQTNPGPLLYYPTDGAERVNTPYFYWQPIANTSSYVVYFYHPQKGYKTYRVTNNYYHPEDFWAEVEVNETWQWAVKASIPRGWKITYTDWSVWFRVTKKELEAPVPSGKNYADIKEQPTFSWQPVTGADKYLFKLYQKGQTASFHWTYTGNNHYKLPKVIWDTLGLHQTYYWKVRAKTGDKFGDWSSDMYFTKRPDKLAKPIITGPPDNHEFSAYQYPYLKWSASQGAEIYTIYFTGLDNQGLYWVETTNNWYSFAHPDNRDKWNIGFLPGKWRWKVVADASWSSPVSSGARILIKKEVETISFPILLEPANGGEFRKNPGVFKWEPVRLATKYQLIISDPYGVQIYGPALESTERAISEAMWQNMALGTWSWRVRAINDTGEQEVWRDSAWRSFTKKEVDLAAPTDGQPTNGEKLSANPSQFSWSSIGGVAGYVVRFKAPGAWEHGQTKTTETYSLTISDNAWGAMATGVWYWQVAAVDEQGATGPYSQEFSFEKILAPLTKPEIESPADDAEFSDTGPGPKKLKWKKVEGVDNYLINLIKSGDDKIIPFRSITNSYSISQDTWKSMSLGSYRWWVRACRSEKNRTTCGLASKHYSFSKIKAANQKPTIEIISPKANDVLRGKVEVVVEASDSDGSVSKVDVYYYHQDKGGVEEIIVDTDGSDGWGGQWDTTAYPDGPGKLVARVKDNDGAMVEVAQRVPIVIQQEIPNQPPVAKIEVKEIEKATRKVVLSGHSSYDPDGKVTSYSWDLGDESIVWTSTSPGIAHIYPKEGTYTVKLTVMDDKGDANTAETEVVISAVPEEPELPEEKVEWLTYNNSRFNFSLKYPKDWTIEESFNKDGATFTSLATRGGSVAVPAYPEAKCTAFGSHLVLPGSNLQGWRTLEEIVVDNEKAWNKMWQGFPHQIIQKGYYTVNGKKGFRTIKEVSKNITDFKSAGFLYASLNKQWVVSCEFVKDKADYYLEIANQMINSLKITEPEEEEEEEEEISFTGDIITDLKTIFELAIKNPDKGRYGFKIGLTKDQVILNEDMQDTFYEVQDILRPGKIGATERWYLKMVDYDCYNELGWYLGPEKQILGLKIKKAFESYVSAWCKSVDISGGGTTVRCHYYFSNKQKPGVTYFNE